MLLLQRKLSYLLLSCSSSSTAAAHKTLLISSSHHLLVGLLRFSTDTSKNPSPNAPFIVQYLINSCGFPPDKATKASKHLIHIKSPSNPDSVLRFLKQSGLTDAHIRNLISKYPELLCSKVEKTLRPKFRALQQMGFSESELVQLLSDCPNALRVCNLQPKIEFWRALLGTNEILLKAIKMNYYLLTSSLAETIMPNLSLLRECGIPDNRIVKRLLQAPRLLTSSPDSIKVAIKRTEELGVPRGSGMFWLVFNTITGLSRATVDARFKLLQSLGWSEDEVISAIRKAPALLGLSPKRIGNSMEFLLREVGLEVSYVACNPTLLMYSLERRLIPRHSILRILTQKELLGRGYNFFSVAVLSEDKFVKKFILPHKEEVPGLHEAYVTTLSRQIPSQCKA